MAWVHQNISPLAGPHPATIPNAAQGVLPPQSVVGSKPLKDTHALLGLLFLLNKTLDSCTPSGETIGVAVSVTDGGNSEEVKNLQLLYDSGFIQEEEFLRRMAEISPDSVEGAEWEGHDSFACDCIKETCSQCYQQVKSCAYQEHQESVCSKRLMQCPYCQQTNLPFEGTL